MIKTLEFIDANEEALTKFEQEVKKKNYKVYAVGEHLLFSFGDSLDEAQTFIDEVENSAFDLDIDYAKVKLVYLDKESGSLFASDSAIKDFADENFVDDYKEGLPISVVPYLIEYIFDNQEKFSNEMDKTTTPIETSDQQDSDFTDDVETENQAEDNSDDEFVDDVADEASSDSTDEKQQQASPEADQAQADDSAVTDQQDGAETQTEDQDAEDQADSENYPENKNDYLLEKAIALFDSHRHIRLPQFNEVTNKELQKEVIDAQFTVAKARDAGIDAIYQRLKADQHDSKQVIEAHAIKQAREAHEEVVNKIERNLSGDINKLLTDNDARYEADREAYVQAQIPNLKKKYDADHYADYQSVMNEQIAQLRKRSQQEIEEENKRFADYVDGVFQDQDEKIVNSVELDDIMSDYNQVAEEQKDLLTTYAKGLKGQIGDTMSGIMQERDQLKDELHEVASQSEAQKANEQGRIQAGITKGIQETREQLKKQSQEELDQAFQKEQDLLKKVDALNETIDSLKKENKSLQREYIPQMQENDQQQAQAGQTQPAMAQAVYPAPDKRMTIIKLAVSGVIALAFLGVGGVAVSKLSNIGHELAVQNYVDKSRYLEQLEADGRYDKTADKMREFGAKKDSIASMYLAHGKYLSALKTDSGILNDFYSYVGKKNEDRQKEILENVASKNVLSASQKKGVKVRLAVLNKDTDQVVKLTKRTDKDSAKVAIAYLIDQKDTKNAKDLLDKYPNKKLQSKLNKLEAENLKTEIADLKTKQADNSKKAETLNNDLQKIKDSKDKDKDQKAKDKEKEITDNNNEAKDLQSQLDEKQKALKKLEN